MGINKRIIYVAALGTGLAVCGQGKGQTQPPEPGLPLTVWVENWAGVTQVELASAQHVAAKVFRKAGVEVNWHTVPAPGLASLLGVDASLILRILESKDAGFPEPSLGFRWQRGPDDVRAIVFIDRIEQFARRSNVRSDTAAILGCAMVHELGHLLLGPAHSREGVMRAEWNKQDAWAASQGNLDFTPEQVRLMRVELGRRVSTRR
jgi:hypothetical protein